MFIVLELHHGYTSWSGSHTRIQKESDMPWFLHLILKELIGGENTVITFGSFFVFCCCFTVLSIFFPLRFEIFRTIQSLRARKMVQLASKGACSPAKPKHPSLTLGIHIEKERADSSWSSLSSTSAHACADMQIKGDENISVANLSQHSWNCRSFLVNLLGIQQVIHKQNQVHFCTNERKEPGQVG